MLLSTATVDHWLGREIKACDMSYTTQVVWKYSGNNCCTTGPVCHSFVKLNVTLCLLNEQKGTNNTSSYSFFFHNPAVSQDAQNVRNVLNSNPAHLCVSTQDWSTFLKETCTADLKTPRLEGIPQNGHCFVSPSLKHLCARMCIDMVIIYKKTLEKGSDDVTSNSTGLGPVSYFLLHSSLECDGLNLAFIAAPPKAKYDQKYPELPYSMSEVVNILQTVNKLLILSQDRCHPVWILHVLFASHNMTIEYLSSAKLCKTDSFCIETLYSIKCISTSEKIPFPMSLSSQPCEMKSSGSETGPLVFMHLPVETGQFYRPIIDSQNRTFPSFHWCHWRRPVAGDANWPICLVFWQLQAQIMSQGSALFSLGLAGESHTSTCTDVVDISVGKNGTDFTRGKKRKMSNAIRQHSVNTELLLLLYLYCSSDSKWQEDFKKSLKKSGVLTCHRNFWSSMVIMMGLVWGTRPTGFSA